MKIKHTLLAFFGLAISSQAAVVVTTSSQAGPYTPSTTDIINGLSPLTSSGNFDLEGSGGIPILTDGLYPSLALSSLATAGNGGGSGTSLTYQFTTQDILFVNVYGGWPDGGRDEQNFTLEFSTDNGATFGSSIASGLFGSIAGQSATLVSISDNAGNLATGVNAMRINFLIVENGYTGYAEIDVIPEPSSLILLGLGSFAAIGIRRRG